MAFGKESLNPRERRAMAHVKLARLKQAGYPGGPTVSDTLDEALQAVVAASNTTKGKTSGFADRLAKEAVVVGDLASEHPEDVKLWYPRTNWSDGRSMRVDGYYTDGVNHEVLDITGTVDKCCVTTEQAAQADAAWHEGQVLHTNANWEDDRPALVLAQPRISNPAMGEALSRHFQTTVSNPGAVSQA
jgi:hypothetical protein